MSQSQKREVKFIRTQKSQKKMISTSMQKNKPLTERKKQIQPNSMSIVIRVNQKFNKICLSRGFFRMALFKNRQSAKQIIFRYLLSTLRNKEKLHKNTAFTNIKKVSKRFKSIPTYINFLNHFQKTKELQWKKEFFYQMKIRQFLDKNEEKVQQTPRTVGRKRANISESRITSTTQRQKQGQLNKSESSSRIYPLKKNQEILPQKISKQLEQAQLFNLSEDTRALLIRLQRFDKNNYLRQMQKTQNFDEENQRLKKIKNQNRSLRGKYFDNQLTMNFLSNQAKIVKQLQRQSSQLSNLKQEKIKQEEKRKKEQYSAQIEEKRTKRSTSHSNNVENQMKKIMNEIDESLKEKQYLKSKNLISNFLKKYEKEDFAKERVHFYQALNSSLENYNEVQNCLDEVCKILEVLGVADLNQVDQCLRSLKANHKDFNFLITKYRNSEKSHGKQMNNILHNLEKFNDDIIKYLEVQKANLSEKNTAKEKDPLVEKYEQEIKKLTSEIEKQTKKMTHLQMEYQKSKKRFESLQEQNKQYKTHQKYEKQFNKKILAIFDKMNRKLDISRDIQNIRNNEVLKAQKPFSLFLQFHEKIQHLQSEKIGKEVNQIEKLLTNVGNVFHKSRMNHEKRFAQIARILETSGKKDPHLCELHKSLQILMITIVNKTEESSGEKENQKEKLQKLLNDERLKTEKLRNQVETLKTSQPPKQKGFRSQVEKKSFQIDPTQFHLLKEQLEKEVQKKKNLQSSLDESEKKINFYELYEKKMGSILQKRNGINWNKEIQNLKKDEKFKSLQTLNVLVAFKQDFDIKEQEKIQKIAQRLDNLLKRISQIDGKKMSNEKKSGQVTKLFEKNRKTDPQFEQLFIFLEEGIHNLIEVERQNSLAEYNKLKEQKQVLNEKVGKGEEAVRNLNVKINDLSRKEKQKEMGRKQAQKNENFQLKNKIHELSEEINRRKNSQKNLINIMKQINSTIVRKQFLQGDECWQKIIRKNTIHSQQYEELFSAFEKISLISREKLLQERKQNQKSIKSYENDLMELNTLISAMEKRLAEKEEEYRQKPRSSSLSRSRKSLKSNSSQRQNEKKNLKATMQAFMVEEKNMLEKIQSIQNEKQALKQRLVQLQAQKNQFSFENSEIKIQLQKTVTELSSLRGEQSKVVQFEVVSALKNQEADFNKFLERNNAERQEYYESVIIPERVQQAIVQEKSKISNEVNWQAEYQKLLSQQEQIRKLSNASLEEENQKFNRLNEENNKLRLELHEVFVKYEEEMMKKSQALAEYEKIKISHNSLVEKYDQQIVAIGNYLETINTLRNNYHQLEEQYKKQMSSTVNQSLIRSLEERSLSQINFLKDIVETQKFEIKKLQSSMNSMKEGKEEIHRQKERLKIDLNKFLKEKQDEIHYLKMEGQRKMNEARNENFSLERKLKNMESMSMSLNNSRIIDLQTQITKKNIEIRQLEEMVEARKRQAEKERLKVHHLEAEVQNIKLLKMNQETHVNRLEVQLNTLTHENILVKNQLKDLQNKQLLTKNEMIRMKVQSENSLAGKEVLKDEIRNLKREITKINCSQEVREDGKIGKLLKSFQVQKNHSRLQYDQAEVQILKKIQNQVADLVETNRKLQTKILIMEGYSGLSDEFVNTMNFYVLLQNKMEELMNFLIEGDMIEKAEEYQKFILKTRNYLRNYEFQQYFREWVELMKLLFMASKEHQQFQLKRKAEEMLDLKEQMSQILDKQIQSYEEENCETIEKYKMIFSDVKYLLKEYLRGGDAEYLNMICRSLGCDQ